MPWNAVKSTVCGLMYNLACAARVRYAKIHANSHIYASMRAILPARIGANRRQARRKQPAEKRGKPCPGGAACCGSGAIAAANPGAVDTMAALAALAVLAVFDLLRLSCLCRSGWLHGSAADIRRNVWALAAILSGCVVWASLAVWHAR